MTSGSRKKRRNKRSSLRTVSPPTKAAKRTSLPPGLGKLQRDRTVVATKEIFVDASAESCFSLVASQLERRPQWDPVIIDVKSISKDRGCVGATSQVTLNIGGKKLESLATILRYHRCRSISWVFNTRPRVREDWQLEQYTRGTRASVTLAYEIGGWTIARFLYKVMLRRKMKQSLDKMLTQLKAVAEGIEHQTDEG